jgi:hypothetical protein
MTKFILLSCLFFGFLSSCTPLNISVSTIKQHPPLDADFSVLIYKNKKQISAKYEQIGTISITCNKLLSNNKYCDSIQMLDTAKTKAREIGGNALIAWYEKPSFWNNNECSMGASVLKIFHTDSLYRIRQAEIRKVPDPGTWDLRLSLPYINFFKLKTERDDTKLSAGFMGISVGLDYYYKRNQYLSIIAASVTDYFFPIKFVAQYGEREICISRFAGLSNNHRYKFLSFGYGLSYSHNSWKYFSGNRDQEYDNYADIPPDKKYTDNRLGLMFTGYWLPNRNFYIGLIYRPDFVSLSSSSPVKYQHLISIDIGFRIRLKTARKIILE